MNTYYYAGKGLLALPNLVSISCTRNENATRYLQNRDYRQYKPLAPDWNTMVGPYKNGSITKEEYTKRYEQQLSNLNADDVAKELGEDATLLCYEPSNEFCHRHIVAEWLTHYGHTTTEYKYVQPLSPALQEEFEF